MVDATLATFVLLACKTRLQVLPRNMRVSLALFVCLYPLRHLFGHLIKEAVCSRGGVTFITSGFMRSATSCYCSLRNNHCSFARYDSKLCNTGYLKSV